MKIGGARGYWIPMERYAFQTNMKWDIEAVQYLESNMRGRGVHRQGDFLVEYQTSPAVPWKRRRKENKNGGETSRDKQSVVYKKRYLLVHKVILKDSFLRAYNRWERYAQTFSIDPVIAQKFQYILCYCRQVATSPLWKM